MDRQMSLAAGTLVAGKYRVLGILGSGGMGKVYDVLHEQIAKRRALKMLHSDERFSRETVSRFQREIKADGVIQNEHIVEVFDAGELDDGQPYVLMERLEGETLGGLLRRKGPLDLRELCDLVGQVCHGVHAAHEAGIVHRDLKPANIFITNRQWKPFVKILDFGIAKFLRKDAEEMTVTCEGTLLGTPCYMAPEQIRGKTDIDGRTDVYALGVILYECATGQVPYRAESSALLGVLICEGKPEPLGKLRPDLPEVFRDIVMRAMAVDRKARFSSARALGDALHSLVDGASESSRKPAPEAWMKSTARVEKPANLPRIHESGCKSRTSSIAKIRSTKAGFALAGLFVSVGIVPPLVFAQWPKDVEKPINSSTAIQSAGSISSLPIRSSASACAAESEDAPVQSMIPAPWSSNFVPTTSTSVPTIQIKVPVDRGIVTEKLPGDK